MSSGRLVRAAALLGFVLLAGCGAGPDSAGADAPISEPPAENDAPAAEVAHMATDAGAIPSPASDAGADAATAPAPPPEPEMGELQTCKASYYASGSQTASGEPFDPNGLTAAHRTLPFNTLVRVINPANGKSVDVRINDRGPFGSTTRCLDLARGAFAKIAPLSAGVVQVNFGVLKS